MTIRQQGPIERKFISKTTGFLLLALGWFLSFLAALALLWHLNRRMRLSDVLVQVKGLEMRVLELEERRDGGVDK